MDALLELTDDARGTRLKERRYGLWYGVVEDDQDPLAIGRVRARPVQIWPAQAHGAPPGATIVRTEELPWAHYCSPYGGVKNAGSYDVPPVGAQVILSFIQGDPAYPVYLGCVWGAPGGKRENGDAPQEVRAVAVATKDHVFRTPEGHVVEIDDNPATRRHRIQTPYGHLILLDDVARSITVTTQLGFRIRMSDADRRTEILTPGGQKVILDDAAQTVAVFATGDVKVTAGNDAVVRVGGNADVRVTGDMTCDVGGNGKFTFGGACDLIANGVLRLIGSQIRLN